MSNNVYEQAKEKMNKSIAAFTRELLQFVLVEQTLHYSIESRLIIMGYQHRLTNLLVFRFQKHDSLSLHLMINQF